MHIYICMYIYIYIYIHIYICIYIHAYIGVLQLLSFVLVRAHETNSRRVYSLISLRLMLMEEHEPVK